MSMAWGLLIYLASLHSNEMKTFQLFETFLEGVLYSYAGVVLKLARGTFSPDTCSTVSLYLVLFLCLSCLLSPPSLRPASPLIPFLFPPTFIPLFILCYFYRPRSSAWSSYTSGLPLTSLVSVPSPLPHFIPPCCLHIIPLQCRRRIRRHAHDQGPAVPHRSCSLGPPGHLQVLLLHRRHLLPLRPAELQDEVRLLDVRPRQDRPGAHRQHCGSEGGDTGVLV